LRANRGVVGGLASEGFAVEDAAIWGTDGRLVASAVVAKRL
jgi:hypothetical protein